MRIVAYIVMALALATLLPWLMIAPMSLMAFDGGNTVMAYTLVGLILAYPIWLLWWLWAAWKAAKAGADGKALGYAVVSVLPAIVLATPLTLPRPH